MEMGVTQFFSQQNANLFITIFKLCEKELMGLDIYITNIHFDKIERKTSIFFSHLLRISILSAICSNCGLLTPPLKPYVLSCIRFLGGTYCLYDKQLRSFPDNLSMVFIGKKANGSLHSAHLTIKQTCLCNKYPLTTFI